MTNKQRETLIRNALGHYRRAKQGNNKREIQLAINDMENTFIAVSLWRVKGTEELRQTILEAKNTFGVI